MNIGFQNEKSLFLISFNVLYIFLAKLIVELILWVTCYADFWSDSSMPSAFKKYFVRVISLNNIFLSFSFIHAILVI